MYSKTNTSTETINTSAINQKTVLEPSKLVTEISDDILDEPFELIEKSEYEDFYEDLSQQLGYFSIGETTVPDDINERYTFTYLDKVLLGWLEQNKDKITMKNTVTHREAYETRTLWIFENPKLKKTIALFKGTIFPSKRPFFASSHNPELKIALHNFQQELADHKIVCHELLIPGVRTAREHSVLLHIVKADSKTPEATLYDPKPTVPALVLDKVITTAYAEEDISQTCLAQFPSLKFNRTQYFGDQSMLNHKDCGALVTKYTLDLLMGATLPSKTNIEETRIYHRELYMTAKDILWNRAPQDFDTRTREYEKERRKATKKIKAMQLKSTEKQSAPETKKAKQKKLKSEMITQKTETFQVFTKKNISTLFPPPTLSAEPSCEINSKINISSKQDTEKEVQDLSHAPEKSLFYT